jgi:4-hydroxyphenylacetate 3-monooxygenase
MLRVVNSSGSGIVVNGVKSIGTFVAQSNEVLVGTFPRPGLKDHHVVYFSIPVDTPGLKVVSRSPQAIGAGEFDHPVSRLGDENDTLLIFEDVEVPWERVFQYGADAGFAMRTFPLITEWAHWSILARLATKAEMLVGLFSALPALLGRQKRPDAQEWHGEAVRYLVTLRSFLDAAAFRGGLTPAGHYMPSPDVVTAGRCYSVENYRRILGGLQDLMGQAFINAPTEAALLSPEIGGVLQSVYGENKEAALNRVRLTRLGIDLTVDGFGGRQTLFEIFNATGVATIRGQLAARFSSAPYEELAYATAGIGDADKAIRDIEADWQPHAGELNLDTYDRVGSAYSTGGR